jgi:thioredoxin-related protein
MKQKMIRTLLCIMVAMSSLTVNAQVKAFEKYADMKNVSYVYISKYMLGMASKASMPSVPGVDTKSLASKLTGLQIISSEEKTARVKLKNDVKDILARNKYEVLMQIREDGDKVDIYHCVGKQQSVVVMLMDEDDSATVMIFSGNFTLDDVMKMTK